MRNKYTQHGLTLHVIAGTHSAILGIDLDEAGRQGCLGFSIQRTDLGTATGAAGIIKPPRWLPNMLGFATAPPPAAGTFLTTLTAPLQKFRWGDYTLYPGQRYRFRVIARYGTPDHLTNQDGSSLSDADGTTVEVTTEDPTQPETMVFFNRAAAASEAFNRKFPTVNDVSDASDQAGQARVWLSNGLEEGLLAFLAQASGPDYALHAAVYEFQKPSLLAALKTVAVGGASVHVVYHARQKMSVGASSDQTRTHNEAAITAAGLAGTANLTLTARQANPQEAIMHDKFVVLLKKSGTGAWMPQAVWTGSTNWTDGGLYGQLNVGHGIYDSLVAQTYEALFELLATDAPPATLKQALATLTPIPASLPISPSITPIFSPQGDEATLQYYARICATARCLLVSAPFALSPVILSALTKPSTDTVRLLLLDKLGSLGKGEEVVVIQHDPANALAVATTLASTLHDFQQRLLADRERFHHAGIHIHAKVILADPFGQMPLLVTGSANFSHNSTAVNDENSLVISGHSGVIDIYATDFMRLFEQYHFRAFRAAAGDTPLGLASDGSWSVKFYVVGSPQAHDRHLFAGTLAPLS